MSVVDTVKGALPSVTLPSLPMPSAELQADAKKVPFAALGAGDLVIEKAREELPSIPATVQAKLTEATAFAATLPAKAQARAKAQVVLVKALPVLVRSTVEEKVTKPLTEQRAKFAGKLDELATRGEKVVAEIRKSPSTTAAEKAAAQTVRSAKATTTSAKKAVKATTKAVEDAVETIG
jgi:hypothetical protein